MLSNTYRLKEKVHRQSNGETAGKLERIASRWLVGRGQNRCRQNVRTASGRIEELGLSIAVGKLLCIDYKVEQGVRQEGIEFVFFGGILADEMIEHIHLPTEELEEARFVSIEEITTLLNPWTVRRVPHAIRALQQGKTAYLEDGRVV